MDRKPYWPAIPGIVMGIVFLFVGIKFLVPMASNFGSPSFFGLFPLIWVGIVLFGTLRNIWALFNGPPKQLGRSGKHSGYIKEDHHTGSADRLRELDLMRQDGTITQAEYEAKKRNILNEL